MSLLDLMNKPPETFHGSTYEPDLDRERLAKQYWRVWEFMKDGTWHTLRQISDSCQGSEPSVSARLRDFRKHGHTVERRRFDRGIFEYRLLIRK